MTKKHRGTHPGKQGDKVRSRETQRDRVTQTDGITGSVILRAVQVKHVHSVLLVLWLALLAS